MKHEDDDATRLETQLADEALSLDPLAEWSEGQRLGPYRLKRLLGQGGMGVVWLAEQTEPLEREIALKLLRIRREKPLLEAYFEVERQSLARLNHPNIAQIHDAGRLGNDVMYFAMEYVPGQPLQRLIAQRQLSWRAMAELMIKICAGVHYAHQRGLIHRDLKPANILVSESGDGLIPKVIDFGIAVSSNLEAQGRNHLVRGGGTPAYMPPEQHSSNRGDIDARADVYALGAILAELLYRGSEDGTEFRTVIGEERHQTLAIALDHGPRASDPCIRTMAEGFSDVPRELVAIAHKALSRDREQRYDSASALADELQSWLHYRPVRAMGHGRLYAFKCFVRRNRVVTAAGVLVGLSLVVGILTALHGLSQAREARQVADQRRADAEGLVQFMLGDFAENLRPIGRLDLLDEVGQQALEYLARQDREDQPHTVLNRARALKTLGEVQVTRQQFELALRALNEAEQLVAPWLERNSAQRADFLFESGNIAFWLGAIAYRQQDMDLTERHWRNYLERARALNEVAPEDPRAATELAYAYNNLGTLAEQLGRLDQALNHFRHVTGLRESLILAPDDAIVMDQANTLSWMARIQSRLGRPRAGQAALEQALDLITDFRALNNSDQRALIHEATLRDQLGSSHHLRGDPAAALEQWQLSLELQQQIVANDPTRPRRHAALARTAFLLARNPLIPGEQAYQLAARGNEIRQELAKNGNLPTDRWLDQHYCLAAIATSNSLEQLQQPCMNQVWPETLAAARSPEADPQLRELAVELGLEIASAFPGRMEPEVLNELDLLLEKSVQGQPVGLRHLRLRHALAKRLQPHSERLLALERLIDQTLLE